MEKDEFFANIDTKVAKINKAETLKGDAAADNRHLIEEVVARLQSVVSTYKAKLKERKIHAEVLSYPSGISFTLRYPDGGHRSVSIGENFKNNRIEITLRFTSDDGKDYTGTTGLTYDRNNWKDSIFEEAIQKCISDFLSYSDRHGGIHVD